MEIFDTDLLVVGGGSGGIRVARLAAQRGARVMLAEAGGSTGLGGTCVNLGCIPKKLYSYAAHYAEDFADARGFGWEVTSPRLNWATLKNHRRAEIARLNKVYQQLLASSGVQRIDGHARLLDAHHVVVASGTASSTVSARNILIATGGWPHLPQFPGRDLVLTSNGMFDIEPFPERLLVVGGGYIACEFASIFNSLGARVIQVYRGDQILRGFDDEVRHFLAAEMVKKGVDLRLSSDVVSIERSAAGLQVRLQGGGEAVVDAILYATGRIPNVKGLGLKTAAVAQGKDGAVLVDESYRTSVPSIYALGDVTARVQLTPVALGEAMALVDQLFGPAAGKPPRKMSYEFIPTAVFTHPGVATVGFSEADARREFAAVDIYRSEFKALKHTLSGSAERTLMKLVVDATSDRVVGLHMVGPDAGEIAQGFAVAMKAGATKALFDSTIGIHPTIAEEFITMREVAVSVQRGNHDT